MASVQLNTPQGDALQNAIQKKLAEYNYTDEDDSVMSEYCLVMLANRKSRANITTELSDLIGADSYDPKFTDWLFEEMERVYSTPVASTSTSSANIPASSNSNATQNTQNGSGGSGSGSGIGGKRPREDDEKGVQGNAGGSVTGAGSVGTGVAGGDGPQAIQTVQDSRESGYRGGMQRDGRPAGRGGPRDNFGSSGPRQQRGVFDNAVSNLNRGRRDEDGPPTRRQRLDDGTPSGGRMHGVPTGPRLMNGNDDRKPGGGAGGRSIFDRVGPPPNQNTNTPFQNGGGGGGDGFQNPGGFPNGMGRGMGPGGPGGPMGMGVPMSAFQQGPDGTFFLPPGAMAGFGPQPGMGGMMMPPQQFGYHPHAPQMMMPPHGGPFPQQHQQQQQFRPQPQMQPQQKPTPPLPSKPTETQLCTFNTECKKPHCPYSHASPVATKESGLVLSEEACPKQLDCADKDCSLSHVSPAQKSAKANANTSPTIGSSNPNANANTSPSQLPQAQPQASQPAQQQAFYVDPSSIPGAGTKPCKFGPACTRPGCVFVHPWDVAPCRYGFGCTRPDCKFSHPPGRKFQNKTLIVNGAGSKDGIGRAPEESKELVSERLKRFAKDVPEGEKEIIIPTDSTPPKADKKEETTGTVSAAA
ncbi:hypothetical protein BT69DRAFT_1354391 [Atractiella rhizophila]|nr:hypothetical protein BT69DRAFT_1354391 [Atractiella rhizophila]